MIRLLVIGYFALLISNNGICQEKAANHLPVEQIPFLKHELLSQKANYANHGQYKPTGTGQIFDTSRWQYLIDSTWGYGLADTDKIKIFNRVWESIDSTFPCFVGLPLYNWDSLVNSMRAEISAGVSRGRFAAILNKLRLYLNDGHTNIYDYTINYPSTIYPGLPLFRSNLSGQFGACVTMQDDSSALVYDADSSHPFHLQAGDIILGYNGLPWKDLVKIILDYQLPISTYMGSTEAATYHRMISSAGENWYLFDTINIKKCDGSIENYPTSLMLGTNFNRICTEQLQIPGVYKLTYNDFYVQGTSISSGLVAGTKIGYIYMLDCSDQTGYDLYIAVKDLIEDSLATSLIFDLRTNHGGSINAFLKAFKYLVNGYTTWVGYGERASPFDRYTMTNSPSSWYDIADNDTHSIILPIAILGGPNALSAGDFFQVLFNKLPISRSFGKSTAGAFGAYNPITIPYSGYYASKQEANFYKENTPNIYLSHAEYPVDQKTWLNQDSVCAGQDNVANDAIRWIQAIKASDKVFNTSEFHIYPIPAKDHLLISGNLSNQSSTTISIISVTGNIISNTIAEPFNGKKTIEIPLEHLPNGVYTVRITNKEQCYSEKIIIQK